MQRRAAEEEHGKRHRQRRAVGDDGAADGVGDGAVDHLHRGVFTVLAEVFAHPVEDHHRLVHRIPQHRQHRRQHGQGEFPLEQGKEAEHDDHVVQVGEDGRHRELPLEAHRQIGDDAEDHQRQRLETIGGQLRPHLRADEFGAALLRLRVGGQQPGHDLGALLRAGLALVQRQADDHIVGVAVGLHLRIGVTEFAQGGADAVDVRPLAVTDFHHRAAGKFDRQIEPAGEEEEHRGGKQHRGDDVERQRIAHERDIALDTEKFHDVP